MPAAHVTTLMSSLPSSWTSVPRRPSIPSWRDHRLGWKKKQTDESIPDEMKSFHHMGVYKKLPLWRRSTETTQSFVPREHLHHFVTCFVAASERFLRVQRQFWTKRWLGSVRWRPKACMPPTHTHSRTGEKKKLFYYSNRCFPDKLVHYQSCSTRFILFSR